MKMVEVIWMMMISNITASFININGIVNKVDFIKDYVIKENIDIMFIVETWLQKGDNVALRPIAADIRKNNVNSSRGTGGIMIITSAELRNNVKIKKIDTNNNWIQVEIEKIQIVCAYMPPAMEEIEVNEFWREMELLARDDDDLIIIGDFNSRMRSITGDKRSNTRGNKLVKFLHQSSLEVRLPEIGRWTTYNYHGRGVTDLVLTKRNDGDVVASLEVKEMETLGGSDHRPLQMVINVGNLDNSSNNHKWNLNKLRDGEVRRNYHNSLAVEVWRIRAIIKETWIIINKKIKKKEIMMIKERERIIEKVWNTITKWLADALDRSCGKTRSNITTRKEFLTKSMEKMIVQMDNARQVAQDAIEADEHVDIIKDKWRKYGKLRSDWNKRAKNRKTVVYRRTIDLLNFPEELGTFTKMISAIKKKESRGAVQLDPAKMDGHRAHFITTFGGKPTGNDNMVDDYILESSNDQAPLAIKRIASIINLVLVKRIISEIPLGKAAGIDNLPGEIWKWSGEIVADILVELFKICEILVVIPKDWRKALIAPIYKSKGDPSSVSNYRPIAVTCVARRLYEKAIKGYFDIQIENSLVDNQGGFRRGRSTFDQITRLHEAMVNNDKVLLTFLDIKAAYDCVDRRILWTDMVKDTNISTRVLKLLRSLFDHNMSTLVVQGIKSLGIANLRGLLQGSSLSPCLFNCFINSLSDKLNGLGGGISSKAGQPFNNLLFADDMVLSSTNKESAQRLLHVCSKWSTDHGIEFAPHKCGILRKKIDSDGTSLKIYGEDINEVEDYTYLGISIDKKGINWEKSMKKRIDGAINRIHWMSKKGMNAFGWRPIMSLNIYKSFIRPMMEYGLALQLVPKSILRQLQNVQNLALRRIASVNKSTSIAALHSIFGLESMAERNQLLNMKYFSTIINGYRKNHPVGEVIQKEREDIRKVKGASLLKLFMKNSKWNNIIIDVGRSPTIDELEGSRVNSIINMKNKGGKNSQKLSNIGIGAPHVMLSNAGQLSRQNIHHLIQWLLGKMNNHLGNCQICDGKISTEHMLQCGGAEREIIQLCTTYNIVLRPADNTLVEKMDRIICTMNSWREFNKHAYTQLAELVEVVKIRTLGWEKRDVNIYSDDEDANEILNERLRMRIEKHLTRVKQKKRKKVPTISRRR